jgi:hypothetical protein
MFFDDIINIHKSSNHFIYPVYLQQQLCSL